MIAGALRKATAMSREEMRFRVACVARKWSGWARTVVKRAHWNRADLERIIRREIPGSPTWSAAYAAANAGNYVAAHKAFAQHFAARRSAFPLNPPDLERIAAVIRAAFPAAAQDATARAESLLQGRANLLGYRQLHVGSPPDWHADPVHGRRSPDKYWSRVAYLDAQYGDHKLIWELNRHQHWLTLGRAHALTGDARFYREFVTQMESWLSANPPLRGTNWASMLELAFRSLSWLWALAFFSTAATREGADQAPWTVDLLLAIDRQLRHVQQNLSYYFSPNTHLSGEALALYVAGHALPELLASGERLEIGRAVLVREADRQIRSDGGHAELSAHYHRYSTDFYLLALAVARSAGDPATPVFEQAALRQAEFLRTITDDRGHRPQLGDDDGGQLFPLCGRPSGDCSDTLAIAALMLGRPELAVGPAPEEAYWRCGVAAAQLPSAATNTAWHSAALPASGYYVMRTRAGDHLVFDAGPHGYLNGGHAHADALSIVLTVGGRPLLIDPGTATYTMNPVVRDRFRSTEMHNTLVLDGRSQSQPAGPFDWRATAAAKAPIWSAAPGCEYAEGTHDGYVARHHTRGVLAIHGVGWWILDHVLGAGAADMALHWHLHPDVHLSDVGESSVGLVADAGRPCAIASSIPLRPLAPGDDMAVCSLEYGQIQPATVLQGILSATLPATIATFIPAAPSLTRRLRMETVNIEHEPGENWHAAAFRVRSEWGSVLLVTAVERSGVAGHSRAAPGSWWGTSGLTTDARVAVRLEDASSNSEIILVNGSSLDVGTRVKLPEPAPILRSALGDQVVSTVHVQQGLP